MIFTLSNHNINFYLFFSIDFFNIEFLVSLTASLHECNSVNPGLENADFGNESVAKQPTKSPRT